jgi:GDPmannose 4,6-dehydratase
MLKTALITGITGQDGSYLAEFLLEKGYAVHGIVRHVSTDSLHRIRHIRSRVKLHGADLLDENSLIRLLDEIQPAEFYNLAAMSFVPISWQQPQLTSEVTGLGVLRALEAVRKVNPRIRFYQASSSEMFGQAVETPQSERTPFYPRSPYAVAKVFGHWITVNYRESHGLHACSGILFNHESPRRGLEFVTRKITHTVAQIKMGLASELRLGNLEAKRDWGFAGDYVRAMWLMLQQDQPQDFVIGTGISRKVEDFVAAAFSQVGLDWHDYVVLDAKFHRPAEVHLLEADASKARRELGWDPQITFHQLVTMMVNADLELVSQSPSSAESVRAPRHAA